MVGYLPCADQQRELSQTIACDDPGRRSELILAKSDPGLWCRTVQALWIFIDRIRCHEVDRETPSTACTHVNQRFADIALPFIERVVQLYVEDAAPHRIVRYARTDISDSETCPAEVALQAIGLGDHGWRDIEAKIVDVCLRMIFGEIGEKCTVTTTDVVQRKRSREVAYFQQLLKSHFLSDD